MQQKLNEITKRKNQLVGQSISILNWYYCNEMQTSLAFKYEILIVLGFYTLVGLWLSQFANHLENVKKKNCIQNYMKC